MLKIVERQQTAHPIRELHGGFYITHKPPAPPFCVDITYMEAFNNKMQYSVYEHIRHHEWEKDVSPQPLSDSLLPPTSEERLRCVEKRRRQREVCYTIKGRWSEGASSIGRGWRRGPSASTKGVSRAKWSWKGCQMRARIRNPCPKILCCVLRRRQRDL